MEKELILQVIADNPLKDMPDVAKLLGISRNTLYKRMKLYSIRSGRRSGRRLKRINLN